MRISVTLADLLAIQASSDINEIHNIVTNLLDPHPLCAQCGKPIGSGSRRPRRFCSVRCRVAHHRGQPAITVPAEPPAATDHVTESRIMYQPREKQIRDWAKLPETAELDPMPTDEEFKARWMRSHGGHERGWGQLKRDWVSVTHDNNMRHTRQYKLGLWQGRTDRAHGWPPTEIDGNDCYNLGYRLGYSDPVPALV